MNWYRDGILANRRGILREVRVDCAGIREQYGFIRKCSRIKQKWYKNWDEDRDS
jgi:hypothetical protein